MRYLSFILLNLLILTLLSMNTLSFRHLYRFSFKNDLVLTRRHVSSNNIEAYNQAKNMSVKMPCIILVNPFLDANVGSISRAMLNFGLHELRVVNPECNITSETATTLAVGSVEILKNAKIFNTLEECIADLDIVVATTSRKHSLNQILQSPSETANEIITSNNHYNAGIMFGRERNGLYSDEIALANRRVAIPSFEYYGVLNMAQAVNILAYECWNKSLTIQQQHERNELNNNNNPIVLESNSNLNTNRENTFNPDKLASSKELNSFLKRLLETMGRNKKHHNQNMENNTGNNINQEEEGGVKQSHYEEFNGVSGLTKKNEAKISAIFQRVSYCTICICM